MWFSATVDHGISCTENSSFIFFSNLQSLTFAKSDIMFSSINIKNQQASSKIILVLVCYTLCQNQKRGAEGKMVGEHSVTYKSINY